mgnify:FL=1
MKAEWETIDRYISAHLASRIGEIVKCRITGVQNFGFFATVEDLGGDGLVPVRTLGAERFDYDEAKQQLTGMDSGTTYNVGQKIELRLVEANAATGSLLFELAEGANHMAGRPAPRRAGKGKPHRKGKPGRPANVRGKMGKARRK